MFNPINKPPKKIKKPYAGLKRTPLKRGGKKPKEAGRRYEKSFADKYGYRRQVGSGAFGSADPTLLGDVVGEIGRLRLLFELKSWDKVDGRGEKVVSFPSSLLDKISAEADLLGRLPIFIYHIKGASDEWAVVKYEWLHDTLTSLMKTIEEMEDELINGKDNRD
jgi:hypothetical protein